MQSLKLGISWAAISSRHHPSLRTNGRIPLHPSRLFRNRVNLLSKLYHKSRIAGARSPGAAVVDSCLRKHHHFHLLDPSNLIREMARSNHKKLSKQFPNPIISSKLIRMPIKLPLCSTSSPLEDSRCLGRVIRLCHRRCGILLQVHHQFSHSQFNSKK